MQRLLKSSVRWFGCVALVACSAGDSADGVPGVPDMSVDSGSPWPGDQPSVDAGALPDVTQDTFVPEAPELEPRIERPSASERYVYVVNRALGTVAKIDSETLAVTPIRVGASPSIVETVPNGDTALVLNSAADTVTVIYAQDATNPTNTVDVVEGANELAVAPDGAFAVAFYRNASAQEGDRIGALQEVTAINVETGATFGISVGFNVREVLFDDDATTAFVVTDTGVSMVALRELTEATIAMGVSFGDDPLVDDIDREVAVTRDGHYAVLRSSAHPGLRAVDLSTGEAGSIGFDAIPTDVDLLGDSETVLIALRSLGEIVAVGLEDIVEEQADAALYVALDAPVGLVAIDDDDETALTFSTLNDEQRVGVFDVSALVDGVADGLALATAKSIRGVFPAPSADSAVILHATLADAAGETAVDDLVSSSNAVSILHLASGYAKLILLPTAADDVAFTPTGSHAAIMLADDTRNVQEVLLVNLTTYATTSLHMQAMPEAIGVVPGTNRFFVSQRAATGRISFIDAETGEVEHVSAFQLNAFID